ncbi:MAG: c-type cytochrome [Acidobacteria bacterium]|nr:c-type cytochrome [Acidobacteriota bacterium]
MKTLVDDFFGQDPQWPVARIGATRLSRLWIAFYFLFIFPPLFFAQSPGAATAFEKKCYRCHNIGSGNKKGPDLNGVTAQRSREWLHTFIPSPAAMNRRGDPAAVELFKKFAPETMPDQALSPEEIDGLLALIEGLSNKNQVFIPAGAKLSRSIAAGDVEAGLRLFTGKTLLNRGGTACFTCHDLQDVGLFGGGTLGPNLTAANIKYRDPELIAILQNPNFPTMNSLFATHPLTDEEIVQIFSLLQSVKQGNSTAAVALGPVDLKFPLLGIGFLVLGLAGINQAWKALLRGVQEVLVNGVSPRAKSLDRCQP